MTPDNLRAARTRLGLTEAGLARALGVERTTVMRWERGERAIPAYLALALATIERNAADARA